MAYLIFKTIISAVIIIAVSEVSKKSDTELLIEAELYSKLEDSDCEYCSLSVILDLSEVIEKEKLLDEEWTEGSIASQVKVLVEEIKE